MERILTFAEFAKSFDQKGTELGNSQADVDALTKSTDQFTADGETSCPERGAKSPSLIDGGGEKVISLAVQPDEEEEETEEDGDFVNDDEPATEIEDGEDGEHEE